MILNITGGIVSVEDGVKKAEEFAPARKVRVELHFDVPEDGDAQARVSQVAAMADAQVKSLLGQKTLLPQAAGLPKVTEVPLTDKEKLALQAGVLDEKHKRGPGRPAKKDETTALPPAQIKAPVQTDLEDFTIPAEEPKAETKQDDDELLSAPATEITDQQLTDAVTDHNKKHDGKARVGIRTLIGTYNPDPTKAFMLSQIKQEHRQEFLTKLKDVKAD